MHRIVAVTGATGFIGRMLISRFLMADWVVRALVRPGSLAGFRNPGCETIVGSLDEPESLERLLNNVDAVVHCAGVVRGASPGDFVPVNVGGVTQLARAAILCSPPPRFLYISSLAAREPQLSDYASSKWKGERALIEIAVDLDWMVLRPPAVYGPGDRELLPIFQWMGRGIAPVPGSAGARLSLLYVEDLAAAVLCWLDSANCGSGVYEITDGHQGGYTWDEIVDRVSVLCARKIIRLPLPVPLLRGLAGINLVGARLFGYAPMLTPGKVRELCHPDWVGDNDALSTAIGWNPEFTLEKGLRATMGWGTPGSTDGAH